MTNRVGLGTYPLSTLAKDTAKSIVRLFLESGGYFLDTAPLYGFGEVELLLGEILREFEREEFFVATKCGYIDVEGKSFRTVHKSSKYTDVLRECERSLTRLKLDYVDLYFVHTPDPHTPFDETIAALVELKSKGKIRHIGVSNVTFAELARYNDTGKVEYVQNRFSLLNPLETKLEDYLLEHHIGLVPYHVVERGLLTQKVFDAKDALGKGVLQVARADWSMDEGVRQAERYARQAKDLGLDLSQFAIAWALAKPYVSFALVGLTNPDYLKADLEADGIQL